jgi:hypothetical protein
MRIWRRAWRNWSGRRRERLNKALDIHPIPLIPAKGADFFIDLNLLRKSEVHSDCVGIVQENFCTGRPDVANLGSS